MTRLAALAVLVVAGLAVLDTPPAFSGRVCGTVRSQGHPVEGAQVLSAREGVLAATDAAGHYCLENLRERSQNLRVLALGFRPAERWVQLGPSQEAVDFELTPLRTLSSGHELAPPDESVPVLYLPADSSWLRARPAGAAWDSLRVLGAALAGAAPPGDEAAYWWQTNRLARRLQDRWCGSEAKAAKKELNAAACRFVERARLVTRARAHRAGDPTELAATRRLAERFEASGDARERTWARVVARELDEAERRLRRSERQRR